MKNPSQKPRQMHDYSWPGYPTSSLLGVNKRETQSASKKKIVSGYSTYCFGAWDLSKLNRH